MEIQNDKRIYEHILDRRNCACKIENKQIQQIKSVNNASAFLTHVLFKALVIIVYYFQAVFVSLITDIVTYQLNILFVIIDFWFTKNVNGRRLIGLRWYFGEDQEGNERFMYETRINDEYINTVNSKLFWIVQIIYIIVPIVQLSTTILIAPNLYRISWPNVIVILLAITGGVANLFLFYKAHSAATDTKIEFRKAHGNQFLRKLGPNSIVSYL